MQTLPLIVDPDALAAYLEQLQTQKAEQAERKPPRMWTIREATTETGLKDWFLRSLVRQNKIRFIRAGSRILINADSLIRYMEEGETNE